MLFNQMFVLALSFNQKWLWNSIGTHYLQNLRSFHIQLLHIVLLNNIYNEITEWVNEANMVPNPIKQALLSMYLVWVVVVVVFIDYWLYQSFIFLKHNKLKRCNKKTWNRRKFDSEAWKTCPTIPENIVWRIIEASSYRN